MGSIAIQLMIVTILSKLTGLIREVFYGAAFGTSMIKDVYVITSSMTAILFSFIFMSMQSTFIPMYNGILEKHDRKKADKFTSNLSNTLLLVSVIIIILTWLFAEPITRFMAPGFTGAKYRATVEFLRISMVSIVFSAISAAPISYLNIYNDFLTPATTGMIMNLALIIAAFFSAKYNSLVILASGVVFSKGIQYIFFPRAMRKSGYKHYAILKPFDPLIKEALIIAVPAILSILVSEISIVIDKSIASSVASDGGVSALDYATKILDFVRGIFVVSIITAVYPKLSKLATDNNNRKSFKKLLIGSINMGSLFVIPAIFGLLIFATPITRIFFERGAFTQESTKMVSSVLIFYVPSLISSLVYSLGVRAFYSIKDTKTPFIAGCVQVFIDVSLNFVLSYYFGLMGLAASTSIGGWAGAFIMLLLLRKKIGVLGLSGVFKSISKIILSSSIMSIIAYIIFYKLALPGPEILRFIFMLIIASTVYGLTVLLIGVPEARLFLNRVLKRIKSHRQVNNK